MEQTHELRLKIDATAAQAGAKQFSAALSAVKKAVSDLDRAADGTFAKLANHRPEFDVTPLRAATTEANRLSTALTGAGSASDRAAATIQRTALASASAVRLAEQRITPDAIAAEWVKINELDAAAKETERLRNQITEKNRPARSAGGGGGRGGSRVAELTEEQKATEELNTTLTERLTSLEQERMVLELVASGQFQTAEAAQLFAEAMTAGGGAVDAQTTAMIQQIDAAAKLNEELKKLATDPVKDWMDSVPNWIEAGKQIEMGAINSLRDSIADMIKAGKLDFESLGEAILGVFADVISDKAVKELLTLFGRGETGSGG